MQQVKRSRYLFFKVEDGVHFEVSAFLRGDLRTSPRVHALSILRRSSYEISHAELRFLAGLSARDWIPVSQLTGNSDFDTAHVEELAHKGLLLSDADDAELSGLRRREALLESRLWHPRAALFHFMEREAESARGLENPVDLEELSRKTVKAASSFVKRHGPPPEAFHLRESARAPAELPVVDRQGGLYDRLLRRRTVRAFDTSRPMQLEDLAVLLRYVFGCHGFIRLDDAGDVVLLHKTSPSGGSLHPIEAYPLILNVDGLASGVYHYNVRDHSLELIREIESGEAGELAVELANGQTYTRSAHALIVMTARFLRNHWKYRKRSRTHAVMLMDAGHLSQTFYLVATDLGLGAFFSAAINGPRIEEVLGLDGAEEGALGVCGCGVRLDRGEDLGIEYRPYVPRKTAV